MHMLLVISYQYFQILIIYYTKKMQLTQLNFIKTSINKINFSSIPTLLLCRCTIEVTN